MAEYNVIRCESKSNKEKGMNGMLSLPVDYGFPEWIYMSARNERISRCNAAWLWDRPHELLMY